KSPTPLAFWGIFKRRFWGDYVRRLQSIDPTRGTLRMCQWPDVAVTLFGTHVAETILASVHV
ncbi:hypothetical protein ACEWPL_018530, partial [Roseovarius sp. S1116L3]|uniref:hypothetical protein n=1 Tax=Roseovarius roseus TaxID=3342636 RepID=UPI003B66BCCA